MRPERGFREIACLDSYYRCSRNLARHAQRLGRGKTIVEARCCHSPTAGTPICLCSFPVANQFFLNDFLLEQASGQINDLIQTALSLPDAAANPLRPVPLVGLAIDVLVRLKTVAEPPSDRLKPELKVLSFFFLLVPTIWDTESAS